MPNPWLILGVALAWAASLFAVGAWQREDGATTERTVWQARESKELREANAKILEASNKARQQEAEWAARLADIGANNLKEHENAEKRRKADAAAIRAGALRLRLPAGTCEGAGGGSPGSPAATAALGDGPARGELPGPLAEALLEFAHDADRNTRQLAACQAVILSDRKEP